MTTPADRIMNAQQPDELSVARETTRILIKHMRALDIARLALDLIDTKPAKEALILIEKELRR